MIKPHEINLENFTIGGLLKQIRESNVSDTDPDNPELIEVWMCTISPIYTKPLLQFVENHIDRAEQENLFHLKRFRKKGSGGETFIDAVLCTKEYISFDELFALLSAHPGLIVLNGSIRIGNVPKELPSTKEIAQKWTADIWPMSWKGNPNHQALLHSNLDMKQESLFVDQLVDVMIKNPKCPYVTIIAQQDDVFSDQMRILHTAIDTREQHPLNHSIMRAIEMVARLERLQKLKEPSKTSGYLCHNLVVYTSYEPCAMCAMALVHSRIGRLIYLFRHNRGAIESSYFIGDRRDLNWTFDIWRWVGPTQGWSPPSHLDQLDP